MDNTSAPVRSGRAVGPALRIDLLQSARRHIEQGGHHALSLRAVAREVGVSPRAPYLYFPAGVAELIAAVAIEGFQELISTMEDVDRREEAMIRAVELPVRYVRFGVDHPRLYRAMFSEILSGPLEGLGADLESGAPGHETFSALHEVKARAYRVITAPLVDLSEEERLRAGDPWDFGLAVAALAHGLVGEFIDEGLGKRLSQDQAWSPLREDMTRAVMDMLFHGLLA